MREMLVALNTFQAPALFRPCRQAPALFLEPNRTRPANASCNATGWPIAFARSVNQGVPMTSKGLPPLMRGKLLERTLR